MEVLPRLLRNELLYMLVGKKKKVWQEFINSKIISKTKKQEEDSIKKTILLSVFSFSLHILIIS